ncbi:hypothetical protein KCP70_04825 [Salmonella enterica subsp. enterica]|nr:hypothetical protein KCP70_04825 [Salmonella enterica subsp. enterica]
MNVLGCEWKYLKVLKSDEKIKMRKLLGAAKLPGGSRPRSQRARNCIMVMPTGIIRKPINPSQYASFMKCNLQTEKNSAIRTEAIDLTLSLIDTSFDKSA